MEATGKYAVLPTVGLHYVKNALSFNDMKFRAVIFDLDGTLLDTLDDIADAVNAVLEGMGFPIHDVQTYRMLIGAGVEDLMARALPQGHRDEETIHRCIALVRDLYVTGGLTKTRPYEGIVELLDELAGRGIKMSVLSNKPHETAVRQIEHYFPRHSFEWIQGASSEAPNKPDPLTAIRIAERMGVRPEECIFLGDLDIDMQTAVNAGMYPVGALWGFRSADELVDSGAMMLIETPLDLLALL